MRLTTIYLKMVNEVIENSRWESLDVGYNEQYRSIDSINIMLVYDVFDTIERLFLKDFTLILLFLQNLGKVIFVFIFWVINKEGWNWILLPLARLFASPYVRWYWYFAFLLLFWFGHCKFISKYLVDFLHWSVLSANFKTALIECGYMLWWFLVEINLVIFFITFTFTFKLLNLYLNLITTLIFVRVDCTAKLIFASCGLLILWNSKCISEFGLNVFNGCFHCSAFLLVEDKIKWVDFRLELGADSCELSFNTGNRLVWGNNQTCGYLTVAVAD